MVSPPPPPPPPNGSDDDDPNEEKLFELFRHLRERVFVGSSELVSHVVRGIEAQLETAPRESFATTMLVQLTNWVTSWVDPDAHEGADRDMTEESSGEADPVVRGDDGPPPGDDER